MLLLLSAVEPSLVSLRAAALELMGGQLLSKATRNTLLTTEMEGEF
jgi:hypothetical protein